uniref:Calponin-homology (CH) domain-containing protein n=1 Tax=Oryzias sinensis TaxID=183150 RepID=A0A8C8A470_9TELE
MTRILFLEEKFLSRLKVLLPEDVGAALMDGVVLCHLANHISPRSVCSIHVPSPAVPKLSMAKCRRNVENFLDACKRLGVPQVCLTSSRTPQGEKRKMSSFMTSARIQFVTIIFS